MSDNTYRAEIKKLLQAVNAENGIRPHFARQLRFLGVQPDQWYELQTLPPTSKKKIHEDKYPKARYAFARGLDAGVQLLEYAEENLQKQGLYIIGNKINPAATAKADADMWHDGGDGTGTKDSDILCRNVVFIDIDPHRADGAKNVSATEEEVKASLEQGYVVYQDFAEILGSASAMGFGLSGNGVQIPLALDSLANTPENKELCMKLLFVTAALYGKPGVAEVDCTVYDAKRLQPAYGTFKRKGADRPDLGRKHRRAKFACPEVVTRLSQEKLQSLVDTLWGRLTDEQKAAVDAAMKKERSNGGAARTAVAASSSPDEENIFKKANAIPVQEVATRLGMGEVPRCPHCEAAGSKSDTSVKYLEYNVLKCLHNTCGQRSWSPIDLVCARQFGVLKDPDKATLKKALEWLAESFSMPELVKKRRKKVTPPNTRKAQGIVPANDTMIEDVSMDEGMTIDASTPPPAKPAKVAPVASKEEEVPPYEIVEGRFVHNFWTKADGYLTVNLTNFVAKIDSVAVMDDGTGDVEKVFNLSGRVNTGRVLPKIQVKSSEFDSMSWVTEEWNGRAIICAGKGLADKAREAIQLNSGEYPEEMIYAHSGWRKIGDRHVYLHAGGAVGTSDPVSTVAPNEHTKRFVMPDMGSRDEVRAAYLKSLALLDVAPLRVTAPLWSMVYGAPLSAFVRPRFVAFLEGRSKSLKTSLAIECQAHFSNCSEDSELPPSFKSTYTAAESMIHWAKDTLIVVDDFCPKSDWKAMMAQKALADELVRFQGNGHGRDRMTRDMKMRGTKTARCMMLMTGEEDPFQGLESATARSFKIKIGHGDVNGAKLRVIQNTRNHRLAMRSYIEHLAGSYTDMEKAVKSRHAQLVSEFRSQGTFDARKPEDVAILLIGAELGLDFGVQIGAITATERDERLEGIREALLDMAKEHSEASKDLAPEARFMELVKAAIVQGRAQIIERHLDLSIVGECRGIGWVDDDGVYLEPGAAFAAAKATAIALNEPPLIGMSAIFSSMVKNGWVSASNEKGNKTGKRASGTFGGKRPRVLDFKKEMFEDVLTKKPEEISEEEIKVLLAQGEEKKDDAPKSSEQPKTLVDLSEWAPVTVLPDDRVQIEWAPDDVDIIQTNIMVVLEHLTHMYIGDKVYVKKKRAA